MCWEQFATEKHMKKLIKKWLGITELESEVEELEKITTPETFENYEKQILKILKKPTSTTQISKKINISRSHTSKIINRLEKKNKVFEHSKKGRVILYKRN